MCSQSNDNKKIDSFHIAMKRKSQMTGTVTFFRRIFVNDSWHLHQALHGFLLLLCQEFAILFQSLDLLLLLLLQFFLLLAYSSFLKVKSFPKKESIKTFQQQETKFKNKINVLNYEVKTEVDYIYNH